MTGNPERAPVRGAPGRTREAPRWSVSWAEHAEAWRVMQARREAAGELPPPSVVEVCAAGGFYVAELVSLLGRQPATLAAIHAGAARQAPAVAPAAAPAVPVMAPDEESTCELAVRELVRRGKPQGDAIAEICKLIDPTQREAMRKHYTDGEPKKAVDRWYAAELRKVLEGAGVLPPRRP